MRRIGVGGAALLMLLLAGLGGAAGASAAEYEPEALPEVGHCVKVARGAGEYREGLCVHSVEKGGYYNWHPALESEKLKFSGSGGTTHLTVVGQPTHSVSCIGTNISGTWTGRHTAKVFFELQGCTNSEGKQCQTGTAKSEINGEAPVARLGFIKNTIVNGRPVVEVGLDFQPEGLNTQLIGFECGSILEETRIEGSMIGRISPIDAMTTKSNLLLQVVKGKQQYRKFVGEPEDVLSASWMSGVETLHAPAMFGIAPKSESGENESGPVEIKAKLIEE